MRSFLLTLLPPWVRMMEKATLPERGKKTQKEEAHHSVLGDNFHVLSLPASGKRKWGKPGSESNEVLLRTSEGGTGDLRGG